MRNNAKNYETNERLRILMLWNVFETDEKEAEEEEGCVHNI